MKVIGTSTCDILIADAERVGTRAIEGICGGGRQRDARRHRHGSGPVGVRRYVRTFSRLLNWPLQLAAQRQPELKPQLDALSQDLLRQLTDARVANPQLDHLPVVLDWFNGRRTPSPISV